MVEAFLNDYPLLERLRQAALAPEQQQRLFTMIVAIFKGAIEARSPNHRPPGKAGLRAEKGYYRLLYLEGELHDTLICCNKASSEAPYYDWDRLALIYQQLTDIPELRSEILAELKSALDKVIDQQPAVN